MSWRSDILKGWSTFIYYDNVFFNYIEMFNKVSAFIFRCF